MNELGEEEAMHLLTFSMEGVSFIRNKFMVHMIKKHHWSQPNNTANCSSAKKERENHVHETIFCVFKSFTLCANSKIQKIQLPIKMWIQRQKRSENNNQNGNGNFIFIRTNLLKHLYTISFYLLKFQRITIKREDLFLQSLE